MMDDESTVMIRGRLMPYTLGELWAAIQQMSSNDLNVDYVEAHYGVEGEEFADAVANRQRARERVRELLGMEGSHDSDASEAGQPGSKGDPR